MLLHACSLPARLFKEGKPTRPEHLEEAALSEGLFFPPGAPESKDTGMEADCCCLAASLEEPAS